MLINKLHLATKIPIWYPKYDTPSGDYEVWISKFKMRYASPVVIVQFTKAKHLIGQRFAIRRYDIEKCPTGTNGKIQVYKVPFSMLEPYETAADIALEASQLFQTSKEEA